MTGLRVDHPDGLFDPRGYFLALQRERVAQLERARLAAEPLPEGTDLEAAAVAAAALYDAACAEDPRRPGCRPLYVVAEKILGRGERLGGALGHPRHHRLRVPQPDRRAVRRRRPRARHDVGLPGLHRAARELSRRRLRVEAAHHGADHVERADRARARARPARPARPPLARLHPQQPDRRPARGDRVLSALPDLHHRRRHHAPRPRVRGGGGGLRQAAQPRHHRRALRLRQGRAAPALSRPRRPRLSRRPARLRPEVPAGDEPGHRQGRGGHRLLSLQPPGQPERGGRRPQPLRIDAGRGAPAAGRAPGDVAGRALRQLDPRHQARRGRARADPRAVGDPAQVARRRAPLAAPEPPPRHPHRGPARAEQGGRVSPLPDAGGRLAAGARGTPTRGRPSPCASRRTWPRPRARRRSSRAG